MPIKREFSAGGIVYKKGKGERGKVKDKDTLWLVCQHSQHKGWVFPKGLIGDHVEGESVENTAVREVKEETGVTAEIIQKLKNQSSIFIVFREKKDLKPSIIF